MQLKYCNRCVLFSQKLTDQEKSAYVSGVLRYLSRYADRLGDQMRLCCFIEKIHRSGFDCNQSIGPDQKNCLYEVLNDKECSLLQSILPYVDVCSTYNSYDPLDSSIWDVHQFNLLFCHILNPWKQSPKLIQKDLSDLSLQSDELFEKVVQALNYNHQKKYTLQPMADDYHQVIVNRFAQLSSDEKIMLLLDDKLIKEVYWKIQHQATPQALDQSLVDALKVHPKRKSLQQITDCFISSYWSRTSWIKQFFFRKMSPKFKQISKEIRQESSRYIPYIKWLFGQLDVDVLTSRQAEICSKVKYIVKDAKNFDDILYTLRDYVHALHSDTTQRSVTQDDILLKTEEMMDSMPMRIEVSNRF